jgi:hypothetical protein
VAHHVREPRQDGTGDAPEERDPPLVDLEDAEKVVPAVGHLAEVTEDVAEARSDDRADQRVEQRVPDVALLGPTEPAGPPHHQLGAQQVTERDADAVGRDAQAPDVDAGSDPPLEGVDPELDRERSTGGLGRQPRSERHGARRPNSTKHSWVTGIFSANSRSIASA